MKLYHFPPSTNSLKVRIALLEKGLEFESVVIDLTKQEQKNPEYLKIHPFGQVPALDDDGFIVYDSTIINEYLEDEYPHPPLLPEDSENRARARMMEDYRDNMGERNQEVIAEVNAKIGAAMLMVDKELQGRDYLAGSFSLADIAYMPNVALMDRFKVPLDASLQNIPAWAERLRSRPSYAATNN
jgi:glutathione S-transferase